LMPQLGETVTEGTIASWHKKVGDRVEADEILLEIETDKVSMEIPSPGSGVLARILVDVGETVPVGTVLAVVEVAGEKSTAAASDPPAAESSPASAAAGTSGNGAAAPAAAAASAVRAESSSGAASAVPRQPGQRLSPAVRRLAAEHALELARIEGTGRNGRITRRDVIRYLQGSTAPAAEPRTLETRAAEARTETPSERKIVPFTRIRQLTAEHMVRSRATSAHGLQAGEVGFANVDVGRNEGRDAWRGRRGFSLAYLPFIANAVCEALGEFPNLNASVEGDALVVHPHVNLAIAVDLGP